MTGMTGKQAVAGHVERVRAGETVSARGGGRVARHGAVGLLAAVCGLAGCVDYQLGIDGEMQDAFMPSFQVRKEMSNGKVLTASVFGYGGDAQATLRQDGQPDEDLTGDLQGRFLRLAVERYRGGPSGHEIGFQWEVLAGKQTYGHGSSATGYGRSVEALAVGCGVSLRPRLSPAVRLVLEGHACGMPSVGRMTDAAAVLECQVGPKTRLHFGWRQLNFTRKDWGDFSSESGSFMILPFLGASYEDGRRIDMAVSGWTAGLTIAF